MAIVRLLDGHDVKLSTEQGLELYNVLHGLSEGDEATKKLASQTKSLYLSWRNAPDSYIRENWNNLMYPVLSTWSCKPDRSIGQPQTKFDTEFAIKWDLFLHGKPTERAKYEWAKVHQKRREF